MNLLRLFFLFLLSIAIFGCGPKTETPKPAATQETQTQSAAKDPAHFVDDSFLANQAVKREELQRAIADFSKHKGDSGMIRYKILSRKGELMSAKRDIKASRRFTDAQKDSLLKPLETESVELATDLLAVSK